MQRRYRLCLHTGFLLDYGVSGDFRARQSPKKSVLCIDFFIAICNFSVRLLLYEDFPVHLLRRVALQVIDFFQHARDFMLNRGLRF